MNRPTPFSYTAASEFLQGVFHAAQTAHPGWSVRAWARRLGQKNPAMLAGVLAGKRRMTAPWVELVAKDLKLNAQERRYLHVMVKAESAQSNSERSLFQDILRDMSRAVEPSRLFPLDPFKLIADWYHLAILELAAIPGYQNDAAWIHKRLRSPLEISVIQEAVARLERLGLLKADADGQVRRFGMDRVLVDPRTRADAVRKFHTQTLEQAARAVEELETHERFFQGSMVALKPKDYARLCAMIEEFQSRACQQSAAAAGSQVYFLGTQLVPLTHGDLS